MGRTSELEQIIRVRGWNASVVHGQVAKDCPLFIDQRMRVAWLCGWRRGREALNRMKKNRVHAI